jgi:uncharacterized protein
MAIQLPRQLKNMNLFVDGRGYAGHIDQITLPILKIMTVAHRAGGMDLPIELDMGMEPLNTSFVVSDFTPEIYKLFGLYDAPTTTMLNIRGAMQERSSQTVMPVVINLAGSFKEVNAGNWVIGNKSTLSVTASLTYYKLTIQEDILVEIDGPNMKRIINGVDHLALQRAAIGL